MKLYKFYLSTWKCVKVSREVLEVKEKPKTYIMRGCVCDTRILKSDIGIVSGYSGNTLYLLEDDIEKAKASFSDSLKKKIEREKLMLESRIKDSNELIAKYERGIEDLLKGEEG